MFDLCFVVMSLMLFLGLHSSCGEGGAGCFALVVFLRCCDNCSVAFSLDAMDKLAVGDSGISLYTYLLFTKILRQISVQLLLSLS